MCFCEAFFSLDDKGDEEDITEPVIVLDDDEFVPPRKLCKIRVKNLMN